MPTDACRELSELAAEYGPQRTAYAIALVINEHVLRQRAERRPSMLDRLRLVCFCLLLFGVGAIFALARLPAALWRIAREMFVLVVFGRLEPLRKRKEIMRGRGDFDGL